jgi:hypothetical protein
MIGITNQAKRKGTKKETKKKIRRTRKASKNLMTVNLILMMKMTLNMKQIAQSIKYLKASHRNL